MKGLLALCSNIYPIFLLITDINESIKVLCIKSVQVPKLRRIYHTFKDERQHSKSF